VIINENTLDKKVDNFIQENNLKELNKDPSDMYKNKFNTHFENATHLWTNVHTNTY